jgi:hypothetical protein
MSIDDESPDQSIEICESYEDPSREVFEAIAFQDNLHGKTENFYAEIESLARAYLPFV